MSQDEIEEMQQKYASSRTVVPQYVPSYRQQQQQQIPQQYSSQMMMMPIMAPPPSSSIPNGCNSSLPLNGALSGGEVFGSINFMNESIFNFRIFERKNKSGDKDQKNEENGAQADYDAEKHALSSSSSSSSSSAASASSMDERSEKLKSPEVCESKQDLDEAVKNEMPKQQGIKGGDYKDTSGVEKEQVAEANDNADDNDNDNDENEDESMEHDSDIQPKSNEIDQDWLHYEKEKFMKICETCWDEFVKSKNSQS